MKPSYHLFFTIMLFIAMILPRFNGNNLIIEQEPYDAKYFKAYVAYFRGELPSNEIRPATNWRFLVPLIASFLPVSAHTAINLINALFLVLGLFVFYKTLQLFTIPNYKIWQSLWLFILSFPMFYYASISYVDTALFLFIALSIYATIIHKPWLFIVSILIGLCVKETIALSIPFYLFYYFKTKKRTAILVTLITCLAYGILFFLIKKYAPISSEITRNNFWKFNTNNALINYYRLNTWLSFTLSFGAVGAIFIYQLYNRTFKEIVSNSLYLACFACVFCAFFLYMLSYFSTIADGRIVWLTYFYLLIVIFVPQKNKPNLQ